MPAPKPTDFDAQVLADEPTQEILDAQASVQEASEAGQSMSRADFLQEDGSTLVVSSFQGSEPELHVFKPEEEPVVNPPVLPDAIPEGIQDDGTNTYDESGPPDGLVEIPLNGH